MRGDPRSGNCPGRHTGGSAPTFTVQPSVDQVAVTGATAGAKAVLRDADGKQVGTRTVDALGSTLFRDVTAGPGYVVSVDGAAGEPVTVLGPKDTPPRSLYTDQQLGDGYGYLKTRDGTLLSINVKLPGPVDQGPYPTVVEYSGYDPANPDSVQPASRVAQLLGFATVGVNLRGTGCSGGAYNYFEELESLDGYDAIEAVAAQPWVQGGTVGMVGISFPGITQLFVAKTQPPHLSAITPLSVLDDTYDTLYPGGIFNNGFALGWARDREADARPATRAGQGQEWARKRIAAGDDTCRDNQALRLQSANVTKAVAANAFRRGAASDAIAPESFVHDINVPVFLAGAWQDQETGSHFANMLGNFSPDIPMKITLMNGLHQDSLGPAVLSQWVEFLDFYVAKKIPSIPADDTRHRNGGARTDLRPRRDARTRSLHRPARLRVGVAHLRSRTEGARALRRRCAGKSPMPAFSTTAPAFPLPDTTATTWYLGHDGTLTDAPPTSTDATAADRFQYDPSAFPRTMTSTGDDLSPTYGWKPVPAGKALGYVTEPLARDTVLAGTGSVDLWVRSSKPDVDLEVTISEVRPDGEETYVQSGWLRASQRALDPDEVHRPAPGPDPHARRRRAAAEGRRRTRASAALPVRTRVPRRLADPDRRAAAGRQPPRVGVRRIARHPHGHGLAVAGPAVEGGAPRRVGHRRLDAAACMRHAAGTTVSHVRTAREQERAIMSERGMSSPVYDVADHYVERFAALDPLSAHR